MHACSLDRMKETIGTMSRFGDTGNGGITRYALSKEDLLARSEFRRRMEAIGAVVEIDDIGNMYATLAGSDPGAGRIVMGSHSDSVKKGGNYDGILGVLAAMEVLETVADMKISHKHPLTAMIWTNEEGSLYPPAMMSSGIVCYERLPESIKGKFLYDNMMKSKSVIDRQTTFGEALDKSGFRGEKKYRLDPERYACLFELHIEQGPILEDAGKAIGVVDCVLGMFNYRLRFYGQTVHAGTFPMHKRKDALFGASQALCHLHAEIDKLGRPELVYTTGEIVCQPCVHTCVPDYVDFCIDVRHEDPKVLDQVLTIVKGCAGREWSGCRCEVEKMWNRDTVYWDKTLVACIKKAVEEAGISYMTIHSGAGHDAQFASYLLPSAMIFVPSRGGLSHCEEEYTSPELCTAGATILMNAVLKADAQII
jgi:N-carbamoyl-L-amino-acid hydrolase